MIPLDEIPLLGKFYQEFITPYFNDLRLLERISSINRPSVCPDSVNSPIRDFMTVYWIDNERYIEFTDNLEQLGFKDTKMVFRNCNKDFYFLIYCKHDNQLYVMIKDIYEFSLGFNFFKPVDFYKHSNEFYTFLKAIYNTETIKEGTI